MRHRIAAIAAGACLAAMTAAHAGAALVDAEYAEIRDTSVGKLFDSCLQPAAPVASGSQAGTTPPAPQITVVNDPPAAAAANPTAELKRVLVSWDGVKSPPVIRFIGIPAEAIAASLAGGKPSTPTAVGPSWPVPNMPGFAVAIAKPDELVISVPETLEKLQLAPCPAASGHPLRFTGPGTDLKLGEIQDKVKDFELIYDHGGATKATITTPSDKDAKALDRWVWWRKPVVFAGADVGVKKLKFPARLLDQTDIDRSKNQLIATTTLQDDMRGQAFDYLTDAIRREIRRFEKK
jgi:hypothetical protein